MYLYKSLLLSSLLIVISVLSCKSNDAYLQEDLSLDSSLYEPIYLLFSATGNDEDETEVVCRTSCSLIPIETNMETYCSDEEPVYITREKFDSDGSLSKLLEKKTVEINEEELVRLDSLYKVAVNAAKLGNVYNNSSVGTNSEVCGLSQAIEDFHIVVKKRLTFSNVESTNKNWEAYSDYRTKINRSISENTVVKMWKDSKTGYYWTQSGINVKKNLLEAIKYCEELEYGGISQWALPNKADIVEMEKNGNIFSKFHTNVTPPVKWWTSTSSGTGYITYIRENDDEYKTAVYSPDKLSYVVCVKKDL